MLAEKIYRNYLIWGKNNYEDDFVPFDIVNIHQFAMDNKNPSYIDAIKYHFFLEFLIGKDYRLTSNTRTIYCKSFPDMIHNNDIMKDYDKTPTQLELVEDLVYFLSNTESLPEDYAQLKNKDLKTITNLANYYNCLMWLDDRKLTQKNVESYNMSHPKHTIDINGEYSLKSWKDIELSPEERQKLLRLFYTEKSLARKWKHSESLKGARKLIIPQKECFRRVEEIREVINLPDDMDKYLILCAMIHTEDLVPKELISEIYSRYKYKNQEPLELLGDKILYLIVSNRGVTQFQSGSKFTNFVTALTRNDTFSCLFNNLDLCDLSIGKGKKSCADMFESIVGALYYHYYHSKDLRFEALEYIDEWLNDTFSFDKLMEIRLTSPSISTPCIIKKKEKIEGSWRETIAKLSFIDRIEEPDIILYHTNSEIISADENDEEASRMAIEYLIDSGRITIRHDTIIY